jgi:hypothetical protein
MKTIKLIIGILSILLFIVIFYNACSTGIMTTLGLKEADSSTYEPGKSVVAILGLAILIGGVIGITSRHVKSGAIFAGGVYVLGALIGFLNLGRDPSLIIWSPISLVFGAFTLFSITKMKSA